MSIHIEEEIKDFFNIKNGLSPKRGRYKKIKDEKGNCLWHYWAENEKPENIWDKWSHKLKTENVMEKNSNNETVIDRLVILKIIVEMEKEIGEAFLQCDKAGKV